MTEVQPPASSNGAAAPLAPHPSSAENNSHVGVRASSAATVTAGPGGGGVAVAAQSGSQSPTTSTPGQSSSGRSPKKRRKVNHACVYCRRSHMTCDDDRPCMRCVKRNIGHLCHDEPREPKRPKTDAATAQDNDQEDSHTPPSRASLAPPVNGMSNSLDQQQEANTGSSKVSLPPPPIPHSRSNAGASSVARSPVSVAPRSNLNGNSQTFLGLTDWEHPPPQQQSTYTNPYHQQWMFSAPEVSSEFNLLSDFLGNLYSEELFTGEQNQTLFSDPSQGIQQNSSRDPDASNGTTAFNQQRLLGPPPNSSLTMGRAGAMKPSTTERARENYYLTAADPSQNNPEERMKQVLKAKLEAGLLKPFNYVKGYARLSQYMEKNMAQNSRRRILGQLDLFRPKFRERTHTLTDLDLVHVEEWFEKSLLEYDRVFASMAVPACLWRRTGEIFRGNKEFAELINVPIEQMRDVYSPGPIVFVVPICRDLGKLAIYELVVEDSAVSYWEKFGKIAFDTTQKAMLTSCHLRNPDPNAKDRLIHCCFSFTIRRDIYDIPALIIGNFMPIHPKKQ